ncbi:MAG: hypothetical protein KKH88_04320 [Nanoarchaeota archaeon]|nr:hypothetical protein [Nanoarchaeota archaeon]
MTNQIKRMIEYLKRRRDEAYERVIGGHTPEEQALIREGMKSIWTSCSKERLEKRGILIEKVRYDHFFMSCPKFPVIRDIIDTYLKLGRVEADILYDMHDPGKDFSLFNIGLPGRIIGGNGLTDYALLICGNRRIESRGELHKKIPKSLITTNLETELEKVLAERGINF